MLCTLVIAIGTFPYALRAVAIHWSLDQDTLGKMSPWVNVRRLKFFEECDADLAGPDDGLVLPLIDPVAGAHDPRYEVDKILWHRTFKGRCEMLVR